MHLRLMRQLAALQDQVDDGAGGGGGGQQQDFTKTEAFQQAVAAAAESQVAGLKANRDEFKLKLTKAQEKLQRFGDVDPETVQTLMQRFDSEEEKALLAKGDLDAIVNRRIDKMKQKYDQDLTDRQKLVDASLTRQQSLEQRAIAAEITKAAAEAGALPSAMTDFVQRANGNFALTETGEVIAVDKQGNQLYDVDGKTPLTAKAWATSLQAEASHLFSKANPGGSQGGHNGFQGSGKIGGTQAEREAYIQAKYKLPK